MAEGTASESALETENAAPERRKRRAVPVRIGKWLLGIVLVLLALVAIGLVVLNSPIGKRYIADQIAEFAPASGLKIEVGRIDGSIYGQAVLHDVVLSDPKGKFLTIPLAELYWRPLSWLTTGIDVRKLVAHRGTLLRLPELLPGDPDAPLLPDFDIRIDRFELDDFTIAEGIAGGIDGGRVFPVNMVAKVDIRGGRAFVETNGELGEQDRFYALLDAEPDDDKFDLKLDYTAPQNGVIAALAGLDAGYSAKISGKGTWSEWTGKLDILRGEDEFADLTLTNRAGEYGIAGEISPGDMLTGLSADALGRRVEIAAWGTLTENILDGEFEMQGRAVTATGTVILDLTENLVERLAVDARLTDPKLFGPDIVLERARMSAQISGGFSDLTIMHDIRMDRLQSGDTRLTGVRQQGTATYDSTRFVLPLDANVERVATGNDLFDPRLVNGTLLGTILYSGNSLTSDELRIDFPGLSGRLALDGNLQSGRYAMSGPVAANGLTFDNIGTVNAGAMIDFAIGGGAPWDLRAQVNGRVANVTNATLANLAGEPIRVSGGIVMGGKSPLVFNDMRVDAAKLDLVLDGSVREGETSLAGRGTHVEYGDFTVEATLADDGPRAVLVFASPLPAAGLEDVRVALAPTEDGFAIETEGQSLLGKFDGSLGLFSPADGPTRISIDRLDVWKTSITGDLQLGDGGVLGTLALTGGGLDGTIALAPQGGGQGFDVDVDANDARFGGDTPIAITRAQVDASGLIVGDNSTIKGSVLAEGLRYGSLFLGRLAASAAIENGIGEATASLAGRRGSRFALQMKADFAPEEWQVIARGDVGGKRLAMPRRAVLTKQAGGGWSLAPTQISYGTGATIFSGEFGGGETQLDLQLRDMPLSLIDVAVADFGLGGTISGIIDFNAGVDGIPTGTAKVKVDDLTRSGLVLSSRPADVALSANLTRQRLDFRAVIDEATERRGRVQGRITGLSASGGLVQRLRGGDLFAQLRYAGPADALWRLIAVEAFDLTGPVRIAADATGSLADPQVRGSLASNALRLRSALSGTDVRNVNVVGNFAGSRLRLRSFAGTAPGGGTITGSGIIDLARLGEQIGGRAGTFRGPQIDIRAAAKDAQLLNALGLSATVTGPLRIVSDGNGGTIAGRLRVDEADWVLGNISASARLPQISTREINVPTDIAPARVTTAPWRYLIDATATSRVNVEGLGLESEWGADINLRGTTSDPRIGGEARMVRGAYTFAGTRFELERGIIDFDASVPIDPRLDIRAETERDGLTVAVNVRGSALQPEIAFSSVPALPEEEVLARLLFGGSITELSATDALQLGTALASLRGGGGLDPINQLRNAIGLDRLRIVGADPALDRGTGVALGKNIGRRFYVEIITDGRGYSATELEFRVTSWLSLLASVSTIGRESAVAEIRRDY